MSDCLDRDDSPCEGAVFERLTMSGSGMTFPRCDKHYQAYADRLRPVMADIRRRYPKQAPADFDPYACGESWDEDW